MKGIRRIILGLVFLCSPALSAEDLCVARLSVIEGGGITTMDARKLVQADSKPIGEAGEETPVAGQPPTIGPMIDYGDDKDGGTLVDRGDTPVKSGVIQYGDQEQGASPLVDYGDKGAEGNGADPLVFRGDRGPIDLDGPSDASAESSPFDTLIGTAMGGDPEMARGLKLTPRQDGYQFTFENLMLTVMQTPPPKSMKEALAGIEPKAGEAHLRIDAAKKKGAPCVPASWDGNALKLKAESGNRLVLQFSNAKLVKKASKKTRRVFAFQGPMQLGLEKQK